MTIYLKFPDQQTAIDAMTAAGYMLSEYSSHFSGNGWGPMFAIPDAAGHFANVYDGGELAATLQQYVVPAPLTPFNVRAGEDVATVYRCVIVPAALRDTCRAMVVAMAGPTHAAMWSTGLSATGSEPYTHYINSGPVRAELAAMLDDPQLLAAGTGITLEQAQYILSQCDISTDTAQQAADRLGLVSSIIN